MNAVRSYDLIVEPLSHAEKSAYWGESKRFALLFGLSADKLPPDWDAFERYYEDMLASGTIAVTRPAREMADYLLAPPHPAIGPAWRWYAMMTAALLPEPLRRGFGLRFGSFDERTFDASISAIRRAYPLIPTRLRHVPHYIQAERRLASGSEDPRAGRSSGEARSR